MNLVQVWAFGETKEVELLTDRYAIPEMAYPYIYMPMTDFNHIADSINQKFYDVYSEVLCVKDFGRC